MLTPGGLARLGFADPGRALADVSAVAETGAATGSPVSAQVLAGILAQAADPDAALRTLARLQAARPSALHEPLRRVAAGDTDWLARIVAVAGMSTTLAEHLIHSSSLELLDSPLASVDSFTAELVHRRLVDPVAGARDLTAAHRVLVRCYRDCLVQLLARDLCAQWPMSAVSVELSHLADGVLAAGLMAIRQARPELADARLAVIALGKAGGLELNYVSDVDVVFVAGDEETAAAGALAAALVRFISEPGAGGVLWSVDTALRPEGRAGPLVRSLASHLGYYQRWAQTWEFQALLKARPAAGDLALGESYVRALSPLVWSAAAREGFVTDVQAMRRRVEEHLAEQGPDRAARQLKLGRGGLRDVEFSVQLLQLVHGRGDVLVRQSATLPALEALATWGYVGTQDAAALGRAYRFLRTVEHRLQVRHLRRTAVLPDQAGERRIIARSLGMTADPDRSLNDRLADERREVRRIHEKLFYRPLLTAVARLAPGETRLTADAATERLRVLGYADPAAAWRHLQSLTSGVSRRAAIQRALLPVLLEWFATAPEPDGGLLAFRRLSDALGATPWYLRTLRDEGATAEHLAHVLAASRYATDLLMRAPESMAMLADEAALQPRSATELGGEAAEIVRRHMEPTAAVTALRALRRRELFRIAAAQVLGTPPMAPAGPALAALTDAVLAAALSGVSAALAADRGGALPTTVSIVALGRYGGGELGLGSDADVMFVHDPRPGADPAEAAAVATAVITTLRDLLHAPHTDPPLLLDADLRPDGRQGPLVRSIAATCAYYAEQASAWECQALLRARPLAGEELPAQLVAVIDRLRYPAGGVPLAAQREIRRLKARMEAERLPRGREPGRNLKLGPGGLSDVEWTVQMLQLSWAAAEPGLRVTGTLAALTAAREIGAVSAVDAQALTDAWLLASRLRDAHVHIRGRADPLTDSVPVGARELAAMGHLLGLPAGSSGDIWEQWRKVSRRAREVTERIFYHAAPMTLRRIPATPSRG